MVAKTYAYLASPCLVMCANAPNSSPMSNRDSVKDLALVPFPPRKPQSCQATLRDDVAARHGNDLQNRLSRAASKKCRNTRRTKNKPFAICVQGPLNACNTMLLHLRLAPGPVL